MKTFLRISAGILLTLSCGATSDARPNANREGPTQSEPSNYNPDYNSQINTRNWIIPAFIPFPLRTGAAQTALRAVLNRAFKARFL